MINFIKIILSVIFRNHSSVIAENLVLKIKNENILWEVRKIQGELRKLGISIDHKTVWNILIITKQ